MTPKKSQNDGVDDDNDEDDHHRHHHHIIVIVIAVNTTASPTLMHGTSVLDAPVPVRGAMAGRSHTCVSLRNISSDLQYQPSYCRARTAGYDTKATRNEGSHAGTERGREGGRKRGSVGWRDEGRVTTTAQDVAAHRS
jgi:hypothetical protein